MTVSEIKTILKDTVFRNFSVDAERATEEQMYKAVLIAVREILKDKRSKFKKKANEAEGKHVYYMCMEFLIGPSLKNNLFNLGLYNEFSEALSDLGFSIGRFFAEEADPGLGNGGLGRLAACFMDSLTSLSYPARGYSICYEYGLFKQKILEGQQAELPDLWLPSGEPWLVTRADRTFTVRFGGRIKEIWNDGAMYIDYVDTDDIDAVPVDMMISGYGTDAVNSLRLWRARDTRSVDMKLFSQGQYIKAMSDVTGAEIISKVLYPADEHDEGKLLRLSQQYFLVSASLQNIMFEHLEKYGTYKNLPEKASIHINDTHPALCVAELMRILMDECACPWDEAWSITVNTLSYTNHTVMPEALEMWREDLFRVKLPRIHSIIVEINRRFCAELWDKYPGDWNRIARMSIIERDRIKMANLSVVGSHTVNGVSALHSDILKKTVFSDFYKDNNAKFTNVTNGIAHRRWLVMSNPRLSCLLDECIGEGYRKEPERLMDFLKYESDSSVLSELNKIKRENKERLSKFAALQQGAVLDPDTLFDVQIKRMHEYKRQLLNVLRIIAIFNQLSEDPTLDIEPQTFIFSAKAAPGYHMAKRLIELICAISREIDKHPAIKSKLSVVFLENYRVSLAEVLIPAAEISEQISLAGKEASGTGNMKLMINGALTVGTLDGANVEMYEVLGDENFYLFGLRTEQVESLWASGYDSSRYYNESAVLQGVIESLKRGFGGSQFFDVAQYLLYGNGVSDPYMCLADFAPYCAVHDKAITDYRNKEKWARMSLNNIARAGRFAADRAITEYAENIWHTKPVI